MNTENVNNNQVMINNVMTRILHGDTTELSVNSVTDRNSSKRPMVAIELSDTNIEQFLSDAFDYKFNFDFIRITKHINGIYNYNQIDLL